MVPRQRRLTLRAVRPRLTYCMFALLSYLYPHLANAKLTAYRVAKLFTTCSYGQVPSSESTQSAHRVKRAIKEALWRSARSICLLNRNAHWVASTPVVLEALGSRVGE